MCFDALTIGGVLAAFLSGGIMLGVVRHQFSARPGAHLPRPPIDEDRRS